MDGMEAEMRGGVVVLFNTRLLLVPKQSPCSISEHAQHSQGCHPIHSTHPPSSVYSVQKKESCFWLILRPNAPPTQSSAAPYTEQYQTVYQIGVYVTQLLHYHISTHSYSCCALRAAYIMLHIKMLKEFHSTHRLQRQYTL